MAGIVMGESDMYLPEKICSLAADENCETDHIGMSESSVFIYENKVLKVQEYSEEAANERLMQAACGRAEKVMEHRHFRLSI